MARWVRRSPRPSSPTGDLVHHVPARRREGLPILCRVRHVVVAGQDPEPGLLDPVAGMFVAQTPVGWKWIRVDLGRVEVEHRIHGGSPTCATLGRSRRALRLPSVAAEEHPAPVRRASWLTGPRSGWPEI